MRYIRTFESHKKYNEGVVGDMFNKLKNMVKNKVSKEFSKMFGSAAEVEKIIEDYKAELIAKQNIMLKSLRDFAEYVKTTQEGEPEVDDKKMEELSNAYKENKENFEKQIKLSKEKFDIRFKEQMKEEKDPRMKNYIKLMKIEMQQELLERERAIIYDQVGISEEQLKNNNDLSNIANDLQKKTEQNVELEKQETETLKKEPKEVSSEFDMEMAMDDPDNYQWEESPFLDPKNEIEKGDKITYFSKSNAQDNDNYEGTRATVIELLDGSGPKRQVQVRTDEGDNEGFKIDLGKVIQVDRYDEKTKKGSEESGEATEEPKEEVKVEAEAEASQNEEEVQPTEDKVRTDGTF